jgi:hypothetical protein
MMELPPSQSLIARFLLLDQTLLLVGLLLSMQTLMTSEREAMNSAWLLETQAAVLLAASLVSRAKAATFPKKRLM